MKTEKIHNLLFVSIEDLNDFIEPLEGHPQVKTPNINRLTKTGVLFRNAFAAAPACSPARTAVLFGKMPWDTGIYTNKQHWYHAFNPANTSSIFGLLRRHGYQTWGAGKMFYAGIIEHEWDQYFKEPQDPYPRMSLLQKSFDLKSAMIDYGPCPDEGPQYDERNADLLMKKIGKGAAGQVWSLGIYRPHLPFIAPKSFFDLYPEQVESPPGLKDGLFDPDSTLEVEGIAKEASKRIVGNAAFGRKLKSIQQYSAFLRAYLASVSYADYILGRVLDHLEAQGLRDSTYVVLWSDHGYQFGEKNTFHKFSLWERSLRTPLIISGPSIPHGVCDHPVSNVDVGPTILDLMGVERGPDMDGGISLRGILEGGREVQSRAVVSVYGFTRKASSTTLFGWRKRAPQNRDLQLAWSVRDETHRLVKYWNGGIELYDHRVDSYERENLIPSAHERNIPGELRPVVKALEDEIPANPMPRAPNRQVRRRKPVGEGHFPHWVYGIS